MALTLDAALLAAQSNQLRKPRVRLKSKTAQADIPFNGALLFNDDTIGNVIDPFTLRNADGSIGLFYLVDGLQHYFRYLRSDANRTFFQMERLWQLTYINSIYELATDAGPAVVEIDADHIGVFYVCGNDANGRWFKRFIWHKDGTDSTVPAIVENNANWRYVTQPALIKKQNGTYLAIATLKNNLDGKYYFVYWTSSDFITWSTGITFSPVGLTDTNRLAYPFLHYQDDGQLFLWFDYLESTANGAELVNVYYMISLDNGATWSNPVKVTSYDDYTASGRHPWAVQKGADQQTLIFDEVRGALTMSNTAIGWPGGSGFDDVEYFQIDAARRRALCVCKWNAGGYKALEGVVEIDIDAWTVTRYWNTTTSPKYDDNVCLPSGTMTMTLPGRTTSSDPSSVLTAHEPLYAGDVRTLCLLNAAENIIQKFYTDDSEGLGITKNIDLPSCSFPQYLKCWDGHYDGDAKRVYVVWGNTNYASNALYFGYYDVGEVRESYSWNELYRWESMGQEIAFSLSSMVGALGGMVMDKESDKVYIFGSYQPSVYSGALVILQLSTGNEIQRLTRATHATFPYRGITGLVRYGTDLFCSFTWYSVTPSDRGICKIDMGSWLTTYMRPDYDQVDDNTFIVMSELMPDGRIMICGKGAGASDCHGLNLYSPGFGLWEKFDNSNVPGMIPTLNGLDNLWYARFDVASGNFFVCKGDSSDSWSGISQFSLYGFMRQSQYVMGTYSGGVWNWSAVPDNLVIGYQDYNAAVVLHPQTNEMYVFWAKRISSKVYIYWDIENSELDITQYLQAGTDLSTARSIDGKPATIDFILTQGHLFDPFNSLSLYSIYMKKFRIITLEFGEEIGGVNYFQSCGTFYITSTNLRYEYKKMPLLAVHAEDRRIYFKEDEVIVTENYAQLPVDLLNAFLMNEIGLRPAVDYVLPDEMDNQIILYHQWIDTTVWKLLEQVAYRFGYAVRIDQNNKIVFFRVSNANAVNHVYANLSSVFDFSPDDSYSDFTNRIVVTGETRDRISVLYAEEQVGEANGTVGWWGGKKILRINYSQDGEKKCMNPRLVVDMSVASFNFKLGGGGEELGEEDPYHRWVEIVIDVPNMVGLVIGGIAGLITAAYASYIWPGYVSYWGFIAFTMILAALFNVIASVAQYYYTVYAQPIGEERSSVEGSANDLVLQAWVGRVVTKRFDDELCYSSNDCNVVAAHEMQIVQMQRSRVKFSKIAHLQDEEGDTISILHPVSGVSMSVFITDIKRVYKVPEGPGLDGNFADYIEGWKL